MRKVSLFKDEFLWNSDGLHVSGDDGFVKRVEDEHIVVEMNVSEEDYASRILPCVNFRRNVENFCSDEKITISLTNEVSSGLRYGALVVPSTKFPGLHRLKYNQNVCEHCSGFLIDENNMNITFGDIYTTQRKKKTKIEEKAVMVSIKETQIVQKPVFNSETGRWELNDVEEEIIVETQDKNVFDLYDKNGTIVGTHTVFKTETKEVDVLDPHTNEIIYEDVLDENGTPIQIQAFNKRYINENGAEISKEEYEIDGGYIVIDCTLQKICDKFRNLNLS